ncbi:MAG TPA: DUF502 domain-containing protein [Verrucomicrobiae bacterium]|nr:DUF502 domain-containing protein [Verrucomicrobiae bacterium]
MKKDVLMGWRANFLTGLAIVLPAVISIAVVAWLFGTVSNITDTLLIFVPRNLTHAKGGEGLMYWYWSLVALVLAIFLIGAVGLLARNYLGKRLIGWVDEAMLRVPLINKIYGATKQINEAFSSGNKDSFKTVVMVEYPRPGAYSIGFLTGELHEDIQRQAMEKLVCVFIPTTPNPTSGFLILVPEDEVTKLDMSVADGLKFIISLGSIAPESVPHARQKIETGS